MVSCLFHGLRRHTSLIAELGPRVVEFSSSIIFFTYLFKVALDHVDVRVIVSMVDARISNDTDAELVETIGNFATFLLPVFEVFTVKEGLHVNHRRFSEFELLLILLAQLVDITFALLVCLS